MAHSRLWITALHCCCGSRRRARPEGRERGKGKIKKKNGDSEWSIDPRGQSAGKTEQSGGSRGRIWNSNPRRCRLPSVLSGCVRARACRKGEDRTAARSSPSASIPRRHYVRDSYACDPRGKMIIVSSVLLILAVVSRVGEFVRLVI